MGYVHGAGGGGWKRWPRSPGHAVGAEELPAADLLLKGFSRR